jgi:hypothetical protein
MVAPLKSSEASPLNAGQLAERAVQKEEAPVWGLGFAI